MMWTDRNENTACQCAPAYDGRKLNAKLFQLFGGVPRGGLALDRRPLGYRSYLVSDWCQRHGEPIEGFAAGYPQPLEEGEE